MAFKPKHVTCPACGGRMRVPLPAWSRIRTPDGLVTCQQCNGVGKLENWTEEEHATVKANARTIARVVHRLAEQGLFNTRPLNDRDAEMGDLVWETENGLTLGFRLTWKGYQYMEAECTRRPELKRMVHSLTYAGDDVRSEAPSWAQDEYRQSKA